MKIVILGLTITSAWGNGHATTFRSLTKALAQRGHHCIFIEKDVPWYRSHRDLEEADYCTIELYENWNLSKTHIVKTCRDADAVILGSYFPDAIVATEALLSSNCKPVFFYDIDTPVTLAALRTSGRTEYLDSSHIPLYDGYLSFSGGPSLAELRNTFGAQRVIAFYCSVDQEAYQPVALLEQYSCDLGYLGTYSVDRQGKLDTLLGGPSKRLPERRFIVGGALYPPDIEWNTNVRLFSHIAPTDHAAFYSSARFALNITRADMVDAGYSPSVRLFEASACGAAIISDNWAGIEEFFSPGKQIIIPNDEQDVVDVLTGLSDAERLSIGQSARDRILACHTSMHRAIEFEEIVSTGSGPKIMNL